MITILCGIFERTVRIRDIMRQVNKMLDDLEALIRGDLVEDR